jgi:hypothetical protein
MIVNEEPRRIGCNSRTSGRLGGGGGRWKATTRTRSRGWN